MSLPPTTRPARPRAGAASLALLLGAGLLGAFPAPAVAARQPDLTVPAVDPQRSVEAGDRLRVGTTVANSGRSVARPSRLRLYLSRDRALGAGDVLLATRRTPGLRRGREDRTSGRVAVPGDLDPGSWRVVACADATDVVKESREGNNCRTAERVVQVLAPTGGPGFPMEPDPISVGSTVQPGRAVTATAHSHEGTTIETVGADGTTYTLVVPAGALLGPEEITLTPVASVDGLPLSGGMVAGVQLEPHGLMLHEPATLVIDTPDAGPLARQTGFVFHEDGEDLHPYPMDSPQPGDDADVVRMTLTHFSTAGVGSGSSAEQGDLARRAPSRAQSQAASAIAGLLSGERAAQLSGADPDPAVAAQVLAIMDRFHDDVVRPQMTAAETDKALAAEAVALGLGWSRQVALLGDEDDPRHQEILRRVERIHHNVMVESWQECNDHDLRAALELQGIARAAAQLGYAWSDEAFTKALGCARFEVRFDSTIDYSTRWSGNHQNGSATGHWATEATVHTTLLPGNEQGPLTWRSFSYSSQNTISDPGHTCRVSETGVGTAPGRLRANAAPQFTRSLNTVEGAGPPPPVAVFAAVGLGGDALPTETYRYTGCDGSTTTSTYSRWSDHYEDTGKHWTTDPGLQQEDLLDAKTFVVRYDRPSTSVVEETTVEIWHRPAL